MSITRPFCGRSACIFNTYWCLLEQRLFAVETDYPAPTEQRYMCVFSVPPEAFQNVTGFRLFTLVMIIAVPPTRACSGARGIGWKNTLSCLLGLGCLIEHACCRSGDIILSLARGGVIMYQGKRTLNPSRGVRVYCRDPTLNIVFNVQTSKPLLMPVWTLSDYL